MIDKLAKLFLITCTLCLVILIMLLLTPKEIITSRVECKLIQK